MSIKDTEIAKKIKPTGVGDPEEDELGDKFSFSDLIPPIGDFARMPAGSVTHYNVTSFKVAGNITTYATSTGAKIKTTGLHCFEANHPKEISKLLRVEVVRSGRPKKNRNRSKTS